jgi:hypothetical protein
MSEVCDVSKFKYEKAQKDKKRILFRNVMVYKLYKNIKERHSKSHETAL